MCVCALVGCTCVCLHLLVFRVCMCCLFGSVHVVVVHVCARDGCSCVPMHVSVVLVCACVG